MQSKSVHINPPRNRATGESSLFDVAEECDATQRPMPWRQIRFEVNRADVFKVGSLGLSVDGTLVELRILAGGCVDSVNINDRHLLVEHLRLRLDQLSRATVERCAYRSKRKTKSVS